MSDERVVTAATGDTDIDRFAGALKIIKAQLADNRELRAVVHRVLRMVDRPKTSANRASHMDSKRALILRWVGDRGGEPATVAEIAAGTGIDKIYVSTTLTNKADHDYQKADKVKRAADATRAVYGWKLTENGQKSYAALRAMDLMAETTPTPSVDKICV